MNLVVSNPIWVESNRLHWLAWWHLGILVRRDTGNPLAM